MKSTDALFRFLFAVRHRLTAWNTGGEGIHSPYLFYMVRMLFSSSDSYYIWPEIEKQRARLLQDKTLLHIRDFGTGHDRDEAVCRIASSALESRKIGEILFRLVWFLGHEANIPLNIIELGTSLGITTSYLATPNTKNRVLTLEGSPEIVAVAKHIWRQLGVKNVVVVEGNIDDTLYNIDISRARIDVAYIDANHTAEATLRYFDYISSLMGEKSIIILDDIHYSREMDAAWKQIRARSGVTATMDLYDIGLVFFDPHYLKHNYIIRI